MSPLLSSGRLLGLDLHCSPSCPCCGLLYMVLSHMLVVRWTARRLIRIALMRYYIIVVGNGSVQKASVAGDLADCAANASGLWSRQLQTRTWIAIMSTGPVALKASTKRSSTCWLSLIARRTSSTSSVSGGRPVLVIESAQGLQDWLHKIFDLVDKLVGEDGALIASYVVDVILNRTCHLTNCDVWARQPLAIPILQAA